MLKARSLFGIGMLAVLMIASVAAVHSKSIRKDDDDNNRNNLSNATVSFGEWMTTPPTDRFPNLSPAAANHHALIPREVTIKAGGTVNFIIAGFHHVVVYDDGTKPEDINVSMTVGSTGTPAGVPLINDPNHRIYRGLDPSTQPADRVEVVHFPNPGVYLVICGVRGHFVNNQMFGFVRVLPSRN